MMMRKANNRRRAFTLVEATVGMGIMAVLMVGMGSALLLTSKALPSSDAPLDATIVGAEAVDEIVGELVYADRIRAAMSNSIQFDVTRNGVTQTISYAWSGIPGDPLQRKSDAGALGIFVDHVHEFTLTYDTFTPSSSGTVQQESAEQVLSTFDAATAPADYPVTDKGWIAQFFRPTLSADAVSWKVTRVLIKARVHGAANGVTAVQLRRPDAADLPSTTVLEEQLMPESGLSATYLWQEFAFSTVTGVNPKDGLCLTLALNTSDAHLCDVQYDNATGSGVIDTSSGDAGWKAMVGELSHFVYGTVTTAVPAAPGVKQLRSLTVKLRVADDATSCVDATARLLNQPDMP